MRFNLLKHTHRFWTGKIRTRGSVHIANYVVNKDFAIYCIWSIQIIRQITRTLKKEHKVFRVPIMCKQINCSTFKVYIFGNDNATSIRRNSGQERHWSCTILTWIGLPECSPHQGQL